MKHCWSCAKGNSCPNFAPKKKACKEHKFVKRLFQEMYGIGHADGCAESMSKNCIDIFQSKKDVESAWSEEDEKMLADAYIMLDWYKGNNWWAAQYIKVWLKSLKERVQPQWKPSKEQMKQLKSAADIYPDSRLGHALKSLYQDLMTYQNNLKI